MKYRRVIILTLLISSFVHGADLQTQNNNTKKHTEQQLNTLEEKIKQLKQLLKELDNKKTEKEIQLRKTEKQITTLYKKIQKLSNQIKKNENTIKKLNRHQIKLMANKKKLQQLMKNNLKLTYIMTHNSKLILLLNEQQPHIINQNLIYFKHLQQAQRKIVENFQKNITQIQENTTKRKKSNTQLQLHKKQLNSQQIQLKDKQKKRQLILSQTNHKTKNNQSTLQNLNKERQKLEIILSKLNNFSSNHPPLENFKGKLSWPIDGTILFNYQQKDPNTGIAWRGILFKAPINSPVKAIKDGTIVFSDWFKGYGQLIIIDHSNNYLTLYAHNQSLLKHEGDNVLSGEAIALSGNSGGARQPSLYFELRYKGKPKNPTIWLKKHP